jgi:UDP-4-amino-4,6-dideoxy-N-acetyl-beta-L-altrosamine N-acetyltransferase
MYSSDLISIESHIRFIDGLIFSKDRQYPVVKKDNNYLDIVDLTGIDFEKKSSDFGLYDNPVEKIPVVGKILEAVSLKYVFDLLEFKKIKLEVFSNIVKAIDLYKKFNFRKAGVKNINNKIVIYMELEK